MKNIIFDFDGTLADTLELAIQFGQKNHERFAKRDITKEEFRNLSMREALKHIGMPLYRLPTFVFELKGYLNANLRQVHLFPGIAELVGKLAGQGRRLYVLSSNSEENISSVLRQHGLAEHFLEICSDSSIFGKHQVIARMIDRLSLEKDDCLYIGDEVRDYDACRKVGLEMIAVSWGWNSSERLKKSGISKIAGDVRELEAFI